MIASLTIPPKQDQASVTRLTTDRSELVFVLDMPLRTLLGQVASFQLAAHVVPVEHLA